MTGKIQSPPYVCVLVQNMDLGGKFQQKLQANDENFEIEFGISFFANIRKA